MDHTGSTVQPCLDLSNFCKVSRIVTMLCIIADVAIISMDNYNDGSKVVDGNFDGEITILLSVLLFS